MNKTKSFLWEANFPKIFSHTTVAFLKNCTGFWNAKNGDYSKAVSVVEQSVKQSCIEHLRDRFSDCILLPVNGSDNLLPLAYAKKIGLPYTTDVECVPDKRRKHLHGIERFLHRPTFFGKIEEGVRYVLVDDVVCQGGVVSSLNKFVRDNGGIVCAVTALAHSAGNGYIAPDKCCIERLLETFDFCKLQELLRIFGFAEGILELTYQQIMYLLKFKTYTALSNSMHKSSSVTQKGFYFSEVSSQFFN